jgi:hypothetical protein
MIAKIIVVTNLDPAVAQLIGTDIAQIVWIDRIEADLANAVTKLTGRTLNQRFAHAIRSCSRIPTDARERLAVMCESEPPPQDVTHAARIIGMSERSARRALRTWFGSEGDRSMRYLLGWLRLLYVCEPVRAGVKESALASRMSRTARGIQVLAKQFTGQTPGELRMDPEALLRKALVAFDIE